jgi:hypothetical protein
MARQGRPKDGWQDLLVVSLGLEMMNAGTRNRGIALSLIIRKRAVS